MDDNELLDLYRHCTLCPRRCGADRTQEGRSGICGAGCIPSVNLSMLHHGEEPVLSGSRGCGAVFFEGCSLGCIFCQNYDISHGHVKASHEMSVDRLADLFVSLQEQGAHNIDLVTPMHFAPSIAKALELARANRLSIPVIVNTGGYDLPETLKILDGLVDIYMPDLKFFSSSLSLETCHAADYFERACEALDEMYRQTGPVVLGEDGLLLRGMVIRHLMLPGKLFDTKKVLDYIAEHFGTNVYISLMSQYTPMPSLPGSAPSYLKRTISADYYDAAVRHLELILPDLDRVFIQDRGSIGDEMIPDFRS